MWETKCVGCGEMFPANKTPQVGHQASDGSWTNSLCKPCWSKQSPVAQSGRAPNC